MPEYDLGIIMSPNHIPEYDLTTPRPLEKIWQKIKNAFFMFAARAPIISGQAHYNYKTCIRMSGNYDDR